MSEFDIILDRSQQNLANVPVNILNMCNLKMLYLQDNFIDALPNDFFLKLPLLTWLDLRNNHLKTIPVNIGHHQHLENLLLSNNKLEILPNELGLVPNLKVLQIANNPLVYPNSTVVAKGTKAICEYLSHQYEKIISPPSECKIGGREKTIKRQVKSEEEVGVVESFSGDEFLLEKTINSSLIVKSLSNHQNNEKIVHRISKEPSKICLKSYYDGDKYVKASTQTSAQVITMSKATLQQNWMDKLKLLLEEQEKILQQERNLQVLTDWRYEKKKEPIRTVKTTIPLNVPYGTYPEYNTILSREDLGRQIDKFIECSKHPPKRSNVEKLISDLVSELKDMETAYDGVNSPRSEIKEAEKHIMKIMEVHKKILKLQGNNNMLLQ